MNICKLFSKITETKTSPLFNDIIGYNDVKIEMDICRLFSKKREYKIEGLFDDIIGYDNIKRLFSMALNSDEQVSILLSGPPASAKTMFLDTNIPWLCGVEHRLYW
jgi:hypothetical protein